MLAITIQQTNAKKLGQVIEKLYTRLNVASKIVSWISQITKKCEPLNINPLGIALAGEFVGRYISKNYS